MLHHFGTADRGQVSNIKPKVKITTAKIEINLITQLFNKFYLIYYFLIFIFS